MTRSSGNGLPATHRTAFLLGPERVEVREVEVPTPGPGEILLAVGAATTCGTDVKVFRRGGHPRMLKVPGPFGHEVAGTIAAAGPGNGHWREGDRVVVANSALCGVCDYCQAGRENLCTDLHYLNGAFAEYLLVPNRFAEKNTHRIPDALPFEIAALTEPLACVLHGIEACDLLTHSDVAVYGAGPIGLLFVGVLAAEGHRVVLGDLSASRLEVGRRLGAAATQLLQTGGKQAELVRAHALYRGGFDVVIDATGVPEAWADAIRSVRPGGLANLFGGCAPGTSVELDTHLIHYSELTIKGVYHHRPRTVARALDVLSEGLFDARLLISEERRLEELEAALRGMIEGRALKVVVRP